MGKRTLDPIYLKLGQVEMDDMAEGVKALWSRPYFDKTRVGIYGTSYGGYSAVMELLRHPDVFAAASASSPPTDWRNYDTIYTERYMWIPEENKAGYDTGGAMTYAKDLKGRLLLYYGTADNNVHPSNTMQLIKALQAAGKSFEVQVGPDQGHSGVNQDRMMEFFIENLVTTPSAGATPARRSTRCPATSRELQARIDNPPPPRPNQTPPTPAERERAAADAAAELANMRRLQSEHLPKAKRYQDYREMLDKQKDIDAVIVATPDHMHASIALAAMDLGKHVYVQKPLCWSVVKARQLAKRARETKVATQMGNQGHSFDDTRTIVEYIAAGAIGDVREVHIWTNRPLGYWPQGIPRPEAGEGAARQGGLGSARRQRAAGQRDGRTLSGAGRPRVGSISRRRAVRRIPPDLSPVQLARLGRLGQQRHRRHGRASDRSVDVGARSRVSDDDRDRVDAVQRRVVSRVLDDDVSVPRAREQAAGDADVVRRRAVPAQAGRDRRRRAEQRRRRPLIGSKGKLMHNTYGLRPRLLPQSLHDSFGKPRQILPRIANQAHEMNWVDAAKGKTEASSPFEYSAKLTEMMLLGVVALRAGKKIEYDAANMRVTNVPRANDFLRREPRQGWSLSSVSASPRDPSCPRRRADRRRSRARAR